MNRWLTTTLSCRVVLWLTTISIRTSALAWWTKNMPVSKPSTTTLSKNYKILKTLCRCVRNTKICWSTPNNCKAISSSWSLKTTIWWGEWRPVLRDQKCCRNRSWLKNLRIKTARLKICHRWLSVWRRKSRLWSRDRRAISARTFIRVNYRTRFTRWTSIALKLSKNYQWRSIRPMDSRTS